MEGDNGVQLEATHRPGLVPGADDASHRIDTATRGHAPSPKRIVGWPGTFAK
nr:hypothetical protein [Burkholderia ambifaria]